MPVGSHSRACELWRGEVVDQHDEDDQRETVTVTALPLSRLNATPLFVVWSRVTPNRRCRVAPRANGAADQRFGDLIESDHHACDEDRARGGGAAGASQSRRAASDPASRTTMIATIGLKSRPPNDGRMRRKSRRHGSLTSRQEGEHRIRSSGCTDPQSGRQHHARQDVEDDRDRVDPGEIVYERGDVPDEGSGDDRHLPRPYRPLRRLRR